MSIAVDIFIVTFCALSCWTLTWKAYRAYEERRMFLVVAYAILFVMFLAICFLDIWLVNPHENTLFDFVNFQK